MKIALIAPTYLPARRANTLQVMKMAQAMTVLGHEIRVYVPGKLKIPAWDELASHYGLHHPFEIEWLPVRPSLRSYDYGIRAVLRSRRWGANIWYTRLPQAAAVASSVGIPTIYEIHDLPHGTLGPYLFHRFLKGRGARRLVVITRSLREALIRETSPLPPAPFTMVAPDGVDLARYKNLPSPEIARQHLQQKQLPNLPISQFTVGYTGHLYAGRGIHLLLDIAAELGTVTFLLGGGDPEDVSRLQSEVDQRNLSNIILTGFIPNAELPAYQAACEVLVMPYQRRVAASSGGNIADYLSPMKLFEYLACGRAMVSSDLPVLREVLNPKNAVLLPPDERAAWVTALQGLKENPSQRELLATQARQDAQNFSWETRAERILAFES